MKKQLNAWTGVANIYNPEMDVEKLPRLLIESIEIEGPIQKEWPPASHKALLFAGDERRDDAYVREIFARFLPRAYRRPVTDEEIDAIVAIVKDAQDDRQAVVPRGDADRLAASACARPAFCSSESPPANSAKPRPLTDYELASRLSYFLWSTMPDDELFALAAAGKLRDPDVVAAQVQADARRPEGGAIRAELRRPMAVGPRLRLDPAGRRVPGLRQAARSRPRSRSRSRSSPKC